MMGNHWTGDDDGKPGFLGAHALNYVLLREALSFVPCSQCVLASEIPVPLGSKAIGLLPRVTRCYPS